MVVLLSGGRQGPPGSAELVQALAAQLAGLRVGDVVVERMPAVGDLEFAVRALGRSEQRSDDALAGMRLSGRGHRRPEGGAGAVADAHAVLVRREVVQRSSLAV